MLNGIVDKRRKQLLDDLEAAKEKEYQLSRTIVDQGKRIKQLEKLEHKFLENLQPNKQETSETDVEKLEQVKSQLESRILELQSEMLTLESRAHAMRGFSLQFQTAVANFTKASRAVSDIGISIKKVSIGTEINGQLIDCAVRAEEFAQQFRELACENYAKD